MNKSYDNEATQFKGADNEATQFEDNKTTQTSSVNNNTSEKTEEKKSKKGDWKSAVAGAGTGVLIGTLSTTLMGMTINPDKEINEPEKHNNNNEELSHPEWVDDQIEVATSVNDEMTFGEAFAAARTEVGPGGVFEWHGQLYGTYTVEEWNNMSEEERAEYSDHFSWNNIDHSSSDVAQHSTAVSNNETAQVESNDDIEVISVDHNVSDETSTTNIHQTSNEPEGDIIVEPEVEILGVEHDITSGANIGGMVVDGQEVVVIDVDGDLTFDYIAADLNSNGKIEDNEIIDIQSDNLTVNDLGGFTDSTTGSMLASNDGPDYYSETYES